MEAFMKPFPCQNCDANKRCWDVWSDKYFITHPGKITSVTDGDTHFISHADLLRLYNVPPSKAWEWDGMTIGKADGVVFVHLYPDHFGDYDVVAVCKAGRTQGRR